MTGPQTARLRVVSYNIQSGRGDRAALVEVVHDLAPDVLILQEGPRRLRWRTRCAALARGFQMVYAAGGAPSLGNVILTGLRVRVHEERVLRYPLTPGRHLRGAVFARCSLGGVPFVVAGSHLGTDPAERPEQARLLARELPGAADRSPVAGGRSSGDARRPPDVIGGPPGDAVGPQDGAVGPPVVLGVDVNETAEGTGWQTLAGGLADAAGTDATPTFPALAPRDRIDAVLVDRRIQVLGYRVAAGTAARRASDHLPVVADLVLPG